jgi:phospholipase C
MRRMKRRAAVLGLVATVVLACGSTGRDTTDTSATVPAGTSSANSGSLPPPAPPAPAPPPPGSDAGPTGYPIKHVVVVVKENHTFDNYFGTFPGAEGTTTCKRHDGTTFACPHAPDSTPRDLNHGHAPGLVDWDQGKMDGWDLVADTSVNGDNLGYAQYLESDIPNYWQYARKFTLGDHFFAQMIGPSFPGHIAFLTAQTVWAIDNPSTTSAYWGCDQPPGTVMPVQDQATCTQKQVFPCFKIPSVPDVLPSGVTWKFYGTNFVILPEIWSMFDAVDSIRHGPGWSNVVIADQFETDIANGTLPNVSWLVDQDLNSEHPQVGGVCNGENWTVQKINKLMGSKYWADTAILFAWDDFGGWYDHVPPPRQYGCDTGNPYGLGFRLPLIIVSPYAKPGFVFKEVAEQASVPRFIEKIFGSTKTLHDLDPDAQDAQANDLMNAFDFHQAPLPPLVLTERTCPFSFPALP